MTVAELVATLERRAVEAEAVEATAPVAAIYRQVVRDLSQVAGNGRPAPPTAAWLTADEAAARLGTTRRWVYAHGRELGIRRLSRRCVRFDAGAVTRWRARP